MLLLCSHIRNLISIVKSAYVEKKLIPLLSAGVSMGVSQPETHMHSQLMQTQPTKHLRLRAWRALDAVIEAGTANYQRSRLARLIALTPDELAAADELSSQSIVLRLARALRGERARGRAGHWTYDLNRHIALAQAYRAEKLRLEAGA